ncbi:MAG: NifU family protein [Acetobacter sp.]|nr:NifU family protein [Acetobacter sp.]
MFIETEETPNPATLKFLPIGREVMGRNASTMDFAQASSAVGRSPLAEALFAIPGVIRVFLGEDFISVTKASHREWEEIRGQVLRVLMDYFTTGQPIVLKGADIVEGFTTDLAESEASDPVEAAIITQIKELLDTRIRPAVATDGGDIVYRGYHNGVVRLTMQGACSGCPSSRATLRHGVENLLRHYIPEVVAVEQVD